MSRADEFLADLAGRLPHRIAKGNVTLDILAVEKITTDQGTGLRISLHLEQGGVYIPFDPTPGATDPDTWQVINPARWTADPTADLSDPETFVQQVTDRQGNVIQTVRCTRNLAKCLKSIVADGVRWRLGL